MKIILKQYDNFFDFMWAKTTNDGSVMMGLPGNNNESAIKVFDETKGEMIPGKDFFTTSNDKGQSKISFHKSGKMKLTNQLLVSLNHNSWDRVTIDSKGFSGIQEPIRLLEMILPNQFKLFTKNLDKECAIIDISRFPSGPLRCTISCLPENLYDHFSKNPIVDTSVCEETLITKNRSLIWAWTIRISGEDKLINNGKTFYIFSPGNIIWPKELN